MGHFSYRPKTYWYPTAQVMGKGIDHMTLGGGGGIEGGGNCTYLFS